MYHLPAYLALERWVPGRVVVVVQPKGPEGPRRFRDAGARVLVLDAEFASESGIEVRETEGRFPMRDGAVDIVVCLEEFGRLDPEARAQVVAESRRVLKRDGAFVAWLEQPDVDAFGQALGGSSELDFWTFEDELADTFARVDLVSQMPWQGFSLAPIVDDATSEPKLVLLEHLLPDAPEASHYLAVASPGRPTLARKLAAECVLVPLPSSELGRDAGESGAGSEQTQRELADARDEVERMREEFGLRAAKAAASHARVRELEDQVANLRARAGEIEAADLVRLRDALTEAESQLSSSRSRCAELQVKIEALSEERDDLAANRSTDEGRTGQRIEELEDALHRAREKLGVEAEELRSHQTDLAILNQTAAEREKALERTTAQLDRAKAALDEARDKLAQQRESTIALTAERDELKRQVEVSVAEREGSRALAARVEAELEVARRRLAEQEEALAEKIREASRTTGELEGLRMRLGEQDRLLAQSRSRAEELSASAAQGAEQGRMLADVALDRDRLRDELGQRARQLEELEQRYWEAHDTLQRERLEGVRLTGEVERLKERIDRDRQVEEERTQQLDDIGRLLRETEKKHAELSAILRAREQRIEDLLAEQSRLDGVSEDSKALREELLRRSEALAESRAELEQLRAQAERANETADRREREVKQASDEMRGLQHSVDEQASMAARLQGDLDVRALEIEQLREKLGELQAELEKQRGRVRERDDQKSELQRKLEEAAAVRQNLRRRLREREQELEDLNATQENHSLEVFKLRRELESAASANQELSQAISGGDDDDDEIDSQTGWPQAARKEIDRLKKALAEQARQHAEAMRDVKEMESSLATGEQDRSRRLSLELRVRVREQEVMLSKLDTAEQRIWEMTDAADRNAARFQASLAQLEKHKEVVDELNDEIDVTRTLLAAEQERALENERLLASERAKLARAGLSPDGFPADVGGQTENVFRELNESERHGNLTALADDGVPGEINLGESEPIDLGPPGMPLDKDLARLARNTDGVSPAESGTFPAAVPSGASHRARLTVEPVDDEDWPEDEWPDDD